MPKREGLVGVGGSDAAAGRADFLVAAKGTPRGCRVVCGYGHDYVGAVGYIEPARVPASGRIEMVQFLDEHRRIEHGAVADDADRVFAQDAARD